MYIKMLDASGYVFENIYVKMLGISVQTYVFENTYIDMLDISASGLSLKKKTLILECWTFPRQDYVFQNTYIEMLDINFPLQV